MSSPWGRSMRLASATVFALATSIAIHSAECRAQAVQQAAPPATLPARLTDADFWTLVSDISEPGGFFRITDNYTSNEREIGRLFTMLRVRGTNGGVYLGVGPEQNFTYIAAVRPAMAFIIDIRRQAVMQHLMFKAIFELSADRADFIGMLFGMPRPPGIDRSTTIQQIWEAYWRVAADSALAARHYERIVEHLTRRHRFTFSSDESAQLKAVFDAFFQFGPNITTRGARGGGFGGGGGGGGGSGVTFVDLTAWSADSAGRPQSFLASEDNYAYVKALQDKNLIVPVSGDFGGPKALRAIGAYVRQHGAVVSAFYVSNVEQYLFGDAKQGAFYDNVATLPVNSASVFIRPYALRRGGTTEALCPIAPFLADVRAGRVPSNIDALACAK